MMQCPVCGYEMGAFDAECERCKRMGKRGEAAAVAVGAAAVVADVEEQPAAVTEKAEPTDLLHRPLPKWVHAALCVAAYASLFAMCGSILCAFLAPEKQCYTGSIEQLDNDLSRGKPTTAQRDERWRSLRGRYVTWDGTVNNVVGRWVFVQCYPAARGRRDFLDTVANAIFPETSAKFAKSEEKQVLGLRRGQTIRFEGRLSSDCLGYDLVDCRLVQ